MKKIFLVLLLTLILASCCALVSCNNHEHEYVDATTNPTCTEQGYTTHTCSVCGDSYVDSYIDALGHNEKTDVAVAPTCTETGLTEGKHCDRCDAVLVAQETVQALGHNYNAVITQPTCTSDGFTTHTCSRCNDIYQDNYTNALGHNYVAYGEVNTSCALSTYQNYKCTNCQNEKKEYVQIVSGVAAYHNLLDVGETCEFCGHSVYMRNNDGMVLMELGNNMFSAEYYGVSATGLHRDFHRYITQAFLADTVTYIDEYAFADCNISTIIIPESVQKIGNGAFYGCYRLTYVDLPDELNLYIYEFDGSPWLNSLSTETFDGIFYRGNVALWFANSDELPKTSITLKQDTIVINNFLFEDKSYITSITIPNSVKSIGERAFYGCSGLTSITLPDSLIYISDYAFGECTNLHSITIPNKVVSIEERAFEYCSSLETIVLPVSITHIGYAAFSCCRNLTNIIYNGTKEQWNAIEKVDGWDSNLGPNSAYIYTIHCTDGDIEKGE